MEELQAALAGYGYAIEVTGFFGEETQSVVKPSSGISAGPSAADGIADPLDARQRLRESAVLRAHASMSAATWAAAEAGKPGEVVAAFEHRDDAPRATAVRRSP